MSLIRKYAWVAFTTRNKTIGARDSEGKMKPRYGAAAQKVLATSKDPAKPESPKTNYAFAKKSSVPNAGEDVPKSARHKRSECLNASPILAFI
jgi:hypothetical protein